MDITPEMITALGDLRKFAEAVRVETYPPEVDRRAQQAVDLLDNADFFTAIDDAANEGEKAAQSTAESTESWVVDSAEWGDTTGADMAAHQKEN
jgi:hypothetical protein